MKRPKFFQQFSKRESGAERDELAKHIKARRSEYADRRVELTEQKEGVDQKLTQTEKRFERLSGDQLDLLERLGSLEDELEALEKTTVSKMMNYFKVQAIRSELKVGKREKEKVAQGIDVADSGRDALRHRLEYLVEELRGNKEKQLHWQSEQMARFHEEQLRRWEEASYTPEEAAELFTEDHLSDMPINEYVLLLKRFPTEMVTHVSRHGVRDHTGHAWHRQGVGDFHENFSDLLEDGRLKSVISRIIKNGMTKEAVAKHLGLDKAESRQDAENMLKDIVSEGRSSGSYADISAVHFAAEEVADLYYGAERGNEAFVVFPSVFIDSQYGYQGDLSSSGGGYWNDQWVWANEQEGISLNTGVVFLPRDVRVGKETGSRYEVKDGSGIVNETYVDQVSSVLEHPNFDDVMSDIMTELGKLNRPAEQSLADRLHTRVRDELEVTNEKLVKALTTYHAASPLIARKEFFSELGPKYSPPEELLADAVEEILRAAGIYYVEAEDTVSAREYWESYFEEHPEKRPSRIVYYSQSDPTTALFSWKEKVGLTKKSEDDRFRSKDISREDAGAHFEKERFTIMATEAIDYLFPTESTQIVA